MMTCVSERSGTASSGVRRRAAIPEIHEDHVPRARGKHGALRNREPQTGLGLELHGYEGAWTQAAIGIPHRNADLRGGGNAVKRRIDDAHAPVPKTPTAIRIKDGSQHSRLEGWEIRLLDAGNDPN